MVTTIWHGDAGDNEWATAGNWSGDAPSTNNTVIVPALPADTGDNIDGSNNVSTTIGALTFEQGCALVVGSRTAPLQIKMSSADFTWWGTGKAVLDIQGAVTAFIYKAATPGTSNSFGLHLAAAASNALTVIDIGGSGTVGLAALSDTTAALAILTIRSGTVTVGTGVTTTTVNIGGGAVLIECDCTTMNLSGGVVTQTQNKPATLNLSGGRFIHKTSGTIATVNLSGTGILDMGADSVAVTITSISLDNAAQIYDPHNRLTITDAIIINKGGTLSIT